MSNTVRMFGYLRPHATLKAHEIAKATDAQVADALCWSTHDWRDDPEWCCVAFGHIIVDRIPTEDFAAQQVQLLRKQQQALRAAAEVSANEIERQIQSLLAITHESAAEGIAQ